MASNTDEIVELRKIKIHKVLGVKDDGRRLSMSCPFHRDSTPSFVLYPDGSYHCFGCAVHGNNSIDFLLETGATFAEVIEELRKFNG